MPSVVCPRSHNLQNGENTYLLDLIPNSEEEIISLFGSLLESEQKINCLLRSILKLEEEIINQLNSTTLTEETINLLSSIRKSREEVDFLIEFLTSTRVNIVCLLNHMIQISEES